MQIQKTTLFLILLFCLGCAGKSNSPAIHITLVNNRSLKITGFDAAVMQDINRDSTTNIWQSLIPVYRMPVDTELKNYQPVQPGKYQVNNSEVIFTPDTPFLPHQTYFVRYYQYGAGSSALDYIRHNRKPGKQPFTDLIFKP